jgi:hypothetical protein
MVRNPEAYRVVGRVALADVGDAAFCEHCKNPVFDRAVYCSDPALRQQARRSWVVLTDTMYVVRGPDGERQVCRPCVERCGFRRRDENEDWQSLPNAGEFWLTNVVVEGTNLDHVPSRCVVRQCPQQHARSGIMAPALSHATL